MLGGGVHVNANACIVVMAQSEACGTNHEQDHDGTVQTHKNKRMTHDWAPETTQLHHLIIFDHHKTSEGLPKQVK